MNRWLLAKDILLTGAGLAVIFSQVFALHPNDALLGTGLAFTVPTIAEHVKALLPSGGGGASSASQQGRTSRPSSGSPPAGGTGDE